MLHSCFAAVLQRQHGRSFTSGARTSTEAGDKARASCTTACRAVQSSQRLARACRCSGTACAPCRSQAVQSLPPRSQLLCLLQARVRGVHLSLHHWCMLAREVNPPGGSSAAPDTVDIPCHSVLVYQQGACSWLLHRGMLIPLARLRPPENSRLALQHRLVAA